MRWVPRWKQSCTVTTCTCTCTWTCACTCTCSKRRCYLYTRGGDSRFECSKIIMPSSVRAAKQNPGRASPAKGRKPPSPAKSSRSREGLKLPAAFKDLGPIASGAFSTIVKARHVESGSIVAVKAFKCKSEEEAAERDRELEVLRLVSQAGHAREQLARPQMCCHLGSCSATLICTDWPSL